jgi:hypothetical protein
MKTIDVAEYAFRRETPPSYGFSFRAVAAFPVPLRPLMSSGICP